jgi:hypothetical protein
MASEPTKLFLSHATEDKVPFVRELAETLSRSFRVWYDEYSLPPGASIFQSISAGLATCDFGVVVLSKPFFNKKWTQAELGGLFARESGTLRRIIPVWKDVTFQEVRDFSPILADRRAVNANEGVRAVAAFVTQATKSPAQDGFVHTGTVVSHFADLSTSLTSTQTARALAESPAGANLVTRAQNELFDLMVQQATRLTSEAPALHLRYTRSAEVQCFPRNLMQFTIEAQGSIQMIVEATRPASDSVDRASCALDIFGSNRNRCAAHAEPSCLAHHLFTPMVTIQQSVQWQDPQGLRYDNQQLCDLAFQRFYEQIERLIPQDAPG